MNIVVRYYTRTNNTKKLALAIGEATGAEVQDVTVPLDAKADILFLGCSYYAFDVDEAVKTFIIQNHEKIGKIVCFGTSAMLGSTKKQVKKVAESVGVPVSEDEFHCYGSFGPMHKNRPNDKDLKAAKEFAKRIIK